MRRLPFIPFRIIETHIPISIAMWDSVDGDGDNISFVIEAISWVMAERGKRSPEGFER
jgi:hypothetical protein